MRRLVFITLFALCCVPRLSAQTVYPDASSQMTLLQARLPRDAASLGMGATAVLESSSIAYSSLMNSSVAPFSANEMDFSASYALWQPGIPSSSNNMSAGFAYNYESTIAVSMAFAYDNLSDYDIADSDGVIRNSYTPSNLVVSLGAAWRFLEFLSAGFSIHYLYSNIYDNVGYGAPSFDFGLTAAHGPLSAALGVSNMGGKVGGKYSLPSSFYCAGAGTLKAGESQFNLRAEADWYFAGAFRFAAGGCWNWRFLTLRTGYNLGGGSPTGDFFSLGLGLRFESVTLDAAFLPGAAPMGGSTCFTLGFKF